MRAPICLVTLALLLVPAPARAQGDGPSSDTPLGAPAIRTGRLSPAGAALRSLVIPGFGQLYTGRPALGAAFLAAAGGALAVGLFSERVTVECLARPESSHCPAEQVHREVRERPHRTAGIAAAAGVAVLSAVEAYYAARLQNVGEAERGREAGLRLERPGLTVADGGVRLQWVRLRF